MTSREFIQDWIIIAVELFKDLKISYRYDNPSDTHLLHVVPSRIYEIDQEYIKFESECIDKFYNQYSEESICFISDDSIIPLGMPDAVWLGDNFRSDFKAIGFTYFQLENHSWLDMYDIDIVNSESRNYNNQELVTHGTQIISDAFVFSKKQFGSDLVPIVEDQIPGDDSYAIAA